MLWKHMDSLDPNPNPNQIKCKTRQVNDQQQQGLILIGIKPSF